jgi:ferric-dicitrate binding protein FerR (iron transport regulator)
MPRLTEDSQSVPQADESRTEAPLPEQFVRRRQVRGLLLLVLIAILFAILRAGIHRVFTTGWWRLW